MNFVYGVMENICPGSARYSKIGCGMFAAAITHQIWQTVRLLWCHTLQIVWAYCDVTVWELCKDIVMSRCETWVRSSLWGPCEINVMFQFEVTVTSYHDLSMRFVWDHCDVMVISKNWLAVAGQEAPACQEGSFHSATSFITGGFELGTDFPGSTLPTIPGTPAVRELPIQ